MFDRLHTACLAIPDGGLPDGRLHLGAFLEAVESKPDAVIHGTHKTVALFGPYAVKLCAGWGIAQTLECAATLGGDFAAVYEAGPAWCIQERVKHVPGQRAFGRTCAKLGVHDVAENAGLAADGRLVAFDGFFRLNPRPNA